MKKFLLSLLCMMALVVANAAEITVTPTATDGSSNGISFTTDKGSGTTAPAYNTGGADLRVYAKGSITVTSTAGTITKMVFNISKQGLKRLAPITANTGAIATQASGDETVTWTGSATSVTLTVGEKAEFGSDGASKAGQFDFTSFVVTTDGEGGGDTPTPPVATKTTIFEETFAGGQQGDFTIENKVMPDELSYVWKADSYGYMKASAYVSGTNYATESWLISPVIDLAGCSEIALTFDEVFNFFESIDKAKEEARLMVKAEGGDWTQITGYTYPEALGWNPWVSTGDIDLNTYADKKMQIAFVYTSTADKSGTWEVKNVKITGKKEGGTTPVEPEIEKVANLREFIAKADTKNNVEITGALTAVYQNGTNLYVKDDSDWMLIYGSLDNTYNNGDVIPGGVQALWSPFNGLPEMKPVASTVKAGTAGTPIEPTVVMVADVNAEPLNSYIEIKVATITADESDANGRTFNVTDNGGEDNIVLYNSLYRSITVPTGVYTIRGFVAVRVKDNVTTYQVTPIEFLSASGKETVATPSFSVAAEFVEAGTEVAINCSTEGASIHYTLDGTVPTASSTLYTAPIIINEETTIKAIAVKEGMEDSEVATKTYVIKVYEISGTEANFDFNDPASLSPAQEAPEASKGVDVPGVVFTDNGVSVVAEGGSTSARLWGNYNGGIEYRLYNGATLTVSCANTIKITKIEITGAGMITLSVDGTDVTTDNTLAVYEVAEGTDKVVFDVAAVENTKRADIKTIKVTFKDANGAVESIVLDGSDAPAEYYNLQGVRVENPASGLYIVKRGAKVSKEILR